MQYTPPYIRDTQRGREEEKQGQTDRHRDTETV